MADWKRAAGCVLVGLAGSGCYRYVPAGSEPQPGRAIRAELNQEGASALTSKLGPGVTEIDGLLLAREGSDLSILVESYVTQRQGVLNGGNEAVNLPLRHVSMLHEKRIDKVRSGLLGVLLAGGAYAVFEIFGPDVRLFENEEEEDPGPPSVRRSGLRLGTIPIEWFFRRGRVP